MGIIETSEAKCRDCYKCIRNCPVKAIGLNDDQAWVVEESCILCGKCLEICPQNAKRISSQVSMLERFLKSDNPVLISLAPSYLAALDYSTPWKIISGLRKLGVDRIEETAIGAEIIAERYFDFYRRNDETPVISSCCPTVVNLIEINFPELLDYLAPIISPLQAHARMLKEIWGENSKVVFIGPCYSKKEELDGDGETAVDLVLTFTELQEYLDGRKIDPEKLDDEYPDRSSTKARKYPLEKGILNTANLKETMTTDIISAAGVEECLEVFEDLKRGLIEPGFVEVLGCRGSCTGGPAIGNNLGLFAKKGKLTKFADQFHAHNDAGQANDIQLDKTHYNRSIEKDIPTESEIREILALTGKHTPDDETNCGGCGYPSCRDKAVAVHQGLAEPEMCVPYMREKAESLSHVVVERTLNGVIIVDEEMIIQEFNPAADKMFNRKNITTKGKHLSTFVDQADYKQVRETQEKIIDKYKEYEQYDLITRENIYYLPRYGVVIGIILDVTREERRKMEINKMKRESFNRASKVIEEQMKVAQKIAGLLGESTAETKATLLELMEIMKKEGANINGDQD